MEVGWLVGVAWCWLVACLVAWCWLVGCLVLVAWLLGVGCLVAWLLAWCWFVGCLGWLVAWLCILRPIQFKCINKLKREPIIKFRILALHTFLLS